MKANTAQFFSFCICYKKSLVRSCGAKEEKGRIEIKETLGFYVHTSRRRRKIFNPFCARVSKSLFVAEGGGGSQSYLTICTPLHMGHFSFQKNHLGIFLWGASSSLRCCFKVVKGERWRRTRRRRRRRERAVIGRY